MPDLDFLHVSGESKVKMDFTSLDKLTLEASGDAYLSGQIALTEEIRVNLSGRAKMEVLGTAPQLKVRASGDSDLEAFGFDAKNVEVFSSGESNIHVTARDRLEGLATGDSHIKYAGAPSVRKTEGDVSRYKSEN